MFWSDLLAGFVFCLLVITQKLAMIVGLLFMMLIMVSNISHMTTVDLRLIPYLITGFNLFAINLALIAGAIVINNFIAFLDNVDYSFSPA